jgi:hypothetical protein
MYPAVFSTVSNTGREFFTNDLVNFGLSHKFCCFP